MVVLGFAEALGDVGCEDREAEESTGGDGRRHNVVGIKGDSRHEAGCEAGGGVGVETGVHPDDEVAQNKEGSRRSKHRSAHAQHGGFAAQHLVAEEADGRIPGPGDDVSAEMKGIAEGEDGEVVVGRHESEGGDDGLPAAAPCSEEEQASTDGGEAYAGGGEEVGKDTAENSEEKDEISSHGRPQNLCKDRALRLSGFAAVGSRFTEGEFRPRIFADERGLELCEHHQIPFRMTNKKAITKQKRKYRDPSLRSG